MGAALTESPSFSTRCHSIGVNTMIATQSGGYQGIGFALTVNMIVRVYNDIIRDGHVTRGSIGVSWQKDTPETLRALGFDHGVIVNEVQKDGPADRAGVKPEEVNVAEIHDCFTVMGALGTEVLGKAAAGRGARYLP